ncbi:hypothetical protein ACTXG7_29060 [Mycolicibacterium sp. Dal123E01]|uniref:hypothetical protein n=1 Tax=Mycolicibacterium sp. Dal123E01 TaxID=3457578 RepID=UPI00403EE30B
MAVTGGVALVVGGVVGTSFLEVDGPTGVLDPAGGTDGLVAVLVTAVGVVVEVTGTEEDDGGLLVVLEGLLSSPPPHAAVSTLSAMTADPATNFEPCHAVARVEVTPRTSCGITVQMLTHD